eukprot:snap_masked-scaffold_13-processed-gene-8.37-mRNA-1 protein AED:1.00 eAED:1.00 QI:0/-1/0/0/-1/1/1/0/414
MNLLRISKRKLYAVFVLLFLYRTYKYFIFSKDHLVLDLIDEKYTYFTDQTIDEKIAVDSVTEKVVLDILILTGNRKFETFNFTFRSLLSSLKHSPFQTKFQINIFIGDNTKEQSRGRQMEQLRTEFHKLKSVTFKNFALRSIKSYPENYPWEYKVTQITKEFLSEYVKTVGSQPRLTLFLEDDAFASRNLFQNLQKIITRENISTFSLLRLWHATQHIGFELSNPFPIIRITFSFFTLVLSKNLFSQLSIKRRKFFTKKYFEILITTLFLSLIIYLFDRLFFIHLYLYFIKDYFIEKRFISGNVAVLILSPVESLIKFISDYEKGPGHKLFSFDKGFDHIEQSNCRIWDTQFQIDEETRCSLPVDYAFSLWASSLKADQGILHPCLFQHIGIKSTQVNEKSAKFSEDLYCETFK